MVADNALGRGVDVGGGLEAREGGPQEVHVAAGRALGLVADHHQRPAGKRRVGRNAAGRLRIVGVAARAHDQAPATEHAHVGDVRRGRGGRRKGPRQVADWIPQTQPDALGSLVDHRTAVVERVHRQVREHVEVTARIGAGQHVLERGAEVLQVHPLIRQQDELGERQLPFAQDAKRAGHGLALVPLLDHRSRQRVVAGLAVRPQLLHRRHHQREQRRQQFL